MMHRAAGPLRDPAGHALLGLPALNMQPGEVWALLAANGAGKSSLLREMSGCDDAQISLWTWRDQPLPCWHDRSWARVRASLGQRQMLTASLSARTVIEMGAFPFGGMQAAAASQAFAAVVTRWSLETLLVRPWPQLSGGEQQRVQLARSQLQLLLALASGPALWLLDEPLAALDWPHQREVVAVCRDMASRGALVVVSVHDINVARDLSTHSLVWGEGRLLHAGARDDEPWRLALEQAFGVRLGWVEAGGAPWLLPLR